MPEVFFQDKFKGKNSLTTSWPRNTVLSKFHVMLSQGLFVDQSCQQPRARMSPTVFQQLVHLVAGEDIVLDANFAQAASVELKKFVFTFDSASEIHVFDTRCSVAIVHSPASFELERARGLGECYSGRS